MPKSKIFTEPRKPFTVRVDEPLHDKMLIRMKQKGAKNITDYIAQLVEDDILMGEFETKKEQLARAKERK